MAFLSGSVGFERYKVTGADFKHFKDEHIEILAGLAASAGQPTGGESTATGFIAGDHLFDTQLIDRSYAAKVYPASVRWQVRFAIPNQLNCFS